MHIIGGVYGRRKLISPKGQEIRPTLGALRESLFNICQNYIEGAEFLDVFAGSGAVGLEALSRGARHVTFLDSGKNSIQCIEANLTLLDLKGQGKIIRGDAFSSLEKLSLSGKQFDIIYADPPYEKYDLQSDEKLFFGIKVLKYIDRLSLLTPSGSLFIEDAENALKEIPKLETLVFKKSRKVGRATLHQYVKV